MAQNAEKETAKSKNYPKEIENIDMILDNNEESYLIMKYQKIKRDKIGNKKCLMNYEEMKNSDEDISNLKTRRRSDSVDLYKKHKRERDKRSKTLKRSSKNLKLNSNLCDIPENEDLNMNKKSTKNIRNGKEKKVYFPKKFVSIIDVESYKKYNEENTSKDPFEDMEFLKKLNNMNNLDIKHINEGNGDDGKERVNCSCLIY